MTQSLANLSAAALLALPLSGAAFGQSVELRYATSAPPKTVWEMQVVRFQKQVEDASKGSLKINAFLNSQLGSEQDTVQQVARGRIDWAAIRSPPARCWCPRSRSSTFPSCSRTRRSRTASPTTTSPS